MKKLVSANATADINAGKKAVITLIAILAGIAVLFAAVGAGVALTVPPYIDEVGNDNYNEKITGLYLVEQSAARDNNVIIYGSSELRTTEISTHPANFFKGQRGGIQVNLVGRGSCQSLIHAISIAATGDSLTGRKVVLITSPQSYIKEGILPDLFMANFSEQQYYELMADKTIPDDIKVYISKRVKELTGQYNEITGSSVGKYSAAELMSQSTADHSLLLGIRDVLLSPYYAFSRWTANLKDKTTAGSLIREVTANQTVGTVSGETIDWTLEYDKAVAEAQKMTSNNDFGILNDYYTTYVGRKLDQQKNKDKSLSYGESPEYTDLELLLELCKLKGIEPLFIHVPLHGEWSDYTGFTIERRQAYYENVREIVSRYDNVDMLDLTGYEYEDYFLCDVMHLGWKGWLEVDKAIDRYYNEG